MRLNSTRLAIRPAHPGWLVAIAVIFFASIYSYNLRARFVGTLSDSHHQWLTASTLIFVENWQLDGFWNDKGLMLQYPGTIDRSSLNNREPYMSYAQGSALEVYLFARLFPGTPLLELIHNFNMLNQFVIAALLAAIVGLCCRQYNYIFAPCAALIYIFHPAVLYWQGLVFFSDQGVLLPVALALWMEAKLRLKPDSQPRLMFAQSCVLAIATSIDWYSAMLAAILGVMRLLFPLSGKHSLRELLRDALYIATGPALVIGFWWWQVMAMHQQVLVMFKYGYRAGGWAHPLLRLWHIVAGTYIHIHLRTEDICVLYASFAMCLFRLIRNRRDTGALIGMTLMLACVLQLYVFFGHSYNHPFSSLKLMMPLALIGYGMLPAWIVEKTAHYAKDRTYMVALATLSLLIACNLLTRQYFPFWSADFPAPYVRFREVAEWLRKNARYEDIYVSHDFAITPTPPQRIALARHPVYTSNNVGGLEHYMRIQDPRAQFYGILDESDADTCNVSPADIVATIRSTGHTWMVVKIDLKSDPVIKRCLTLTGK